MMICSSKRPDILAILSYYNKSVLFEYKVLNARDGTIERGMGIKMDVRVEYYIYP